LLSLKYKEELRMSMLKRHRENQALGLLPVLLFMILDSFISYLLSFFIALGICIISLIAFRLLTRDKVYQFLLLPASLTMVFYSIFLCLKLEPVLFIYSPLISEVVLVVVLTFIGISKPIIWRWVRNPKTTLFRRTEMKLRLNEFFFVSQVIQNIYTLHLFTIIFYSILPTAMKDVHTEHFLYRDLGVLLGVLIIIYEQIRMMMMTGSLRKEMWLPVLNDNGKVIGCMARSVSRALPRKHCHPIVRVAIVCNGKLYLTKRRSDDYVSRDTIDHPYESYVLFRHSIESTVHELTGKLSETANSAEPRFIIRYLFENEHVKHLVSLFVIHIDDESLLENIDRPKGKLWPVHQIAENLSSGIFSEYFVQEFPFLQNTVLLAENYSLTSNK